MTQIRADRFWRSLVQGVLGIFVLALLTFVAFRLDASAPTAVLLYLLLIVVTSLWASFAPAAVVSAVAVLSLHYFFISPTSSFGLNGPLDVLAMTAFLTIVLVITRLVSRVRASLEQWKDVFENNPTMYFIVDKAGTILSVNPFGAEQLGYTVDELVGRSVLTVFHEADREAAEKHVAACLDLGGETMNWEIRKIRKDGTIRWVRETAKAAPRENHWIVLIACEDITDRKRVEQAAREQASLLDLTHDAILVWDFPRTIVFWNRGAEQLYGFSREEAIGRSSHELLQTEHPLPTPAFEAVLQRDGAWTGELSQTTRDGRTILVESRHVLMRDAEGRRLVLETNRDITDRRLAEDEVRKAQTELAHMARVTTLGEMAASIAHEVDQPLSGVVINANACLRFLSGATPNLEEVRDGLRAIARDGRRASDIVARIGPSRVERGPRKHRWTSMRSSARLSSSPRPRRGGRA